MTLTNEGMRLPPRLSPPRRSGLAVVAAAAGLLAVTLLAWPARASIMVALELPDLVSRAERIAIVDVVSVRSAWDDKHERIYSTIDLSVVESWKGAAMSGGSHIT